MILRAESQRHSAAVPYNIYDIPIHAITSYTIISMRRPRRCLYNIIYNDNHHQEIIDVGKQNVRTAAVSVTYRRISIRYYIIIIAGK